jgi:hypothetical protein
MAVHDPVECLEGRGSDVAALGDRNSEPGERVIVRRVDD